jgi:organic radical activating enzyme
MKHYCSTKFTDLLVHIQGRLIYNCCKAYPERVDLNWLRENPGKLFHTDTMVEDRKLMLEDKSCASCHHGCYKYEEQGLSSERLQQENGSKFISDTSAPLKHLQIALSTDCNLTCMYCSPEWSTSWQKDIEKNGAHELTDFKMENDSFTNLWAKMKQKTRTSESKFFNLLLKEITLADGLESVTITGGEPLLNNQLDALLEMSDDKRLTRMTIITGLGVSANRLASMLKKIKNKPINFSVSAESTGSVFELLRYGISWNDFQERVRMIEDNGNEIEFGATISNISLLGFTNFYETYSKHHKIRISPLSDKPFLMPHVLDDRSKKDFIVEAKSHGTATQFQEIMKSLDLTPNETDRSNLGNYIKQFSSRRSVDISFLPEHFRKWCNL